MSKVLLAEDDPQMSRMYQRILQFEGFEFQVAGNGKLALEKLKTFTPDIILLDVMMPVMNGLDTLTALKADPATSHIPVVMLTNLAELTTANQALAGGAVKYMVKSKYQPDEVALILRDILGGKSSGIKI